VLTGGSLIEVSALHVIISREIKKFFREKTRLFSSLARPLIWLFLVGGGLSRIVPVDSGVNYLQFFFPGILGMTILFNSIFSAISIIWDKEFGYMKVILVAPVSRTSIVVGKALSGTVVSTIQAAVVLLVFPLLGLSLSLLQIIMIIGISLLLSFAISSIGIFIATFYESFESFSVIMNFIVMPMFFLSGAMYPVRSLPDVLDLLSRLNPLTFGIDALKNVIFPYKLGPMGPDFSICTDVGVILLVSVVFTVLGTLSFKKMT
jgi:ABC-2 type transport system permease protein